MSILKIELTQEMQQRLQKRAAHQGQGAADYARSLLLKDLGQQANENPNHSVMEFYGVGREALKDLGVQNYINEMRDEWER